MSNVVDGYIALGNCGGNCGRLGYGAAGRGALGRSGLLAALYLDLVEVEDIHAGIFAHAVAGEDILAGVELDVLILGALVLVVSQTDVVAALNLVQNELGVGIGSIYEAEVGAVSFQILAVGSDEGGDTGLVGLHSEGGNVGGGSSQLAILQSGCCGLDLVLGRAAAVGVGADLGGHNSAVCYIINGEVFTGGRGRNSGLFFFLLTAHGAEAVYIVMFTGGGNDLGLGLAADSAGKASLTLCYTGSFLGDDGLTPLMLMGLECGNNDRCKLCTGSVGVGGEDEALALGHAVDDAFADGPCKGLSGILGNVLTVLEGIQSTLCLGLTHIAPDHGDQLLTGNALVGAEGGLGNAVDHAGILCPCDRIGIPVCCEILKGGGATYRGFALYAIEDSCSHSTGAGALRIKEILPDAAHIACLGDSLYELGIPSVILHIRKGTHLGAEHGRHNAEKHSDDQKQRHDSLECVFHVVSSLDFQIFREQAHFGYYIISIFSYKRKVNFLFFSFFTILFLKMLKYELFLVQSCRFIPLFLYYWLK